MKSGDHTHIEEKIRIGITHGDLNGIGYEIIIKTFLDNRMLEQYTPVVYGVSKVASYHKKTVSAGDFSFNLIKNAGMANSRRANIINCYFDEVKIDLGKITDIAGELAYLALEAAVRDIKSKLLDFIVTAPINKANIQSDKFNFPGHTEYFAKQFEVDDYLMLMISDTFRIGVITGHIPLKDVPGKLSTDLILKKIRIMNDSLVRDFAVRKPKIALLGLNPHAGDGGLLGKEEEDIIAPAIKKAVDMDIMVYGPYPADGFFASGSFRKFDGILAMYHDQGLVPFKALAFHSGVNFTAGLPIVRTSPVHGTAYDLAGKNMASPESFREAVHLGKTIFKNRIMYEELHKNPLPDYLNAIENDRKTENSRRTGNSGKSAQPPLPEEKIVEDKQ